MFHIFVKDLVKNSWNSAGFLSCISHNEEGPSSLALVNCHNHKSGTDSNN